MTRYKACNVNASPIGFVKYKVNVPNINKAAVIKMPAIKTFPNNKPPNVITLYKLLGGVALSIISFSTNSFTNLLGLPYSSIKFLSA